MLRWDKANIPHKGWKYVGIIDFGENVYPGEEIKYEQCEMCGNEKIRYVHILTHPKFDRELRVGCDCASKLVNDYVNPRENERIYRNKTNRRTNFLRQRWKKKEITGNYTLKYKGEYITIMKSKFDSGWGVIFRGEARWTYNNRKIYDLETAKLLAFEMFDELYD